MSEQKNIINVKLADRNWIWGNSSMELLINMFQIIPRALVYLIISCWQHCYDINIKHALETWDIHPQLMN